MNAQKTSTQWKPEYQGGTIVVFRDGVKSHNVLFHNVTEPDYDWISRHCAKHNWKMTVRSLFAKKGGAR